MNAIRTLYRMSTLASAIFASSINADPLHLELTPDLTVPSSASTEAYPLGRTEHHHEAFATGLSTLPGLGGSVLYEHDGQISCRMATEGEAVKFNRRDLSAPLHYLEREASPDNSNAARTLDGAQALQTGLKIRMRATDRLENYPQAIKAFDKATQKLEALIDNPITVVVDVDFGPDRFGEAWDNPNILAGTLSQPLTVTGQNSYQRIRVALNQSAASEEEAALYARLPNGEVLTDLGLVNAVYSPSAIFRALGVIAAEADPEKEKEDLGEPPSIGFNSNFDWDFNPADGIDPGKQDFVGVAVHEIGHLLGFTSVVGVFELRPELSPVLTPLDLFRFIPGAGADFTNAPRVLSSGGDQVFYAGEGHPELALSTGKGPGGDGNQASHWKDDESKGSICIDVRIKDQYPLYTPPINVMREYDSPVNFCNSHYDVPYLDSSDPYS